MAATDPSPSTPQASSTVRTKTQRPPGHDYLRGGVRVAAEVTAWVCTPWALWSYSIPLAIGAVVLLIGLPAVFSTPGDRPGAEPPVAVPGIVTILLVVLHLVAAAASAWALWGTWIAATVTVLCLVVPFTELPRWRALLSATHDRAERPARR
ncbi:hypothetical protein QFZ75_001029 [Streptomyces sp. V3I8]|uniref:hypothetical protein n=1 Tax=Streptomyces sp. V3I8 TaxID=3042279 RepID=UPI0027825945|nr:hypothetical protein [Streptomyces sp. V3I8]MDQ1034613.1 hypothetical protein [Streptomyces sp. V3I8]